MHTHHTECMSSADSSLEVNIHHWRNGRQIVLQSLINSGAALSDLAATIKLRGSSMASKGEGEFISGHVQVMGVLL